MSLGSPVWQVREGHLRYELQIRTTTEDLWASIVELLIPHVGIGIKYSEAPEELRAALLRFSDWVAETDTGLRNHYARLNDPNAPARGWISSTKAEGMTGAMLEFLSVIFKYMGGLSLSDVFRSGIQP